MLNAYAESRKVACTPFPGGKVVRQQIKGGLASVAQKSELAKLIVIAGYGPFMPGTIVYVRGVACALPWANEKYQIVGGDEFILVPDGEIILYDSGPRYDPLNGMSKQQMDLPLGRLSAPDTK